jgi:hypothetical protein
MNIEIKKMLLKLYLKIHGILVFILFFFTIYYECLIIIPNMILGLKNVNENLHNFLNIFIGIVDWIFIGLTYFVFKIFSDWIEEIKKSNQIYD